MPYNTPGLPQPAPLSIPPSELLACLLGELNANLAEPGTALSLCAWGSPGIGKSQVIRQAAKTAGYGVIELRAAQIDSVDVRGLPAVVTEEDGTKVSIWTRPGFFPRPGTGPTVLFLDEINRAAPATQNALFQLLDQHRIGDHVLPDNVVTVGACNRITDGGGVQQMPAALANRYVHLDVEPSLPEWCSWAAGAGINPLLVAFLNYRPEHFNAFDPKARSFPTPRSWSFVDRILSRKHGANGAGNAELALIAGAVGQAAAIECMTFLRLFRNLPDVNAIIANPTAAPIPDASKPDIIYAVAAALAMKATPLNFRNVLTYLDRMPGEFAVFAVKDAIQRNPALKAADGYAAWEIAHQDDLK